MSISVLLAIVALILVVVDLAMSRAFTLLHAAVALVAVAIAIGPYL